MTRHSSEEIERGLLEVAVANGNVRRAAQALAEDGIEVGKSTLERWYKHAHRDRYLQIQAEVLPRVRAQAAEQHMDLAERGMQVEHRILSKLEQEVEEIPSRDLAGAARNVATGAAIHTDKASVLRGEPTLITARHDVSEVVRALRAKGVDLDVIDADAIEIGAEAA